MNLNPRDVPKFLYDEIKTSFPRVKVIILPEEKGGGEALLFERERFYLTFSDKNPQDINYGKSFLEITPMFDNPDWDYIQWVVEGDKEDVRIVFDVGNVKCEHPATAIMGYLIMRLTQLKHPDVFGEDQASSSWSPTR